MDLGIRGKNALVCGASKGLGRACAMSLAREGCNVTIAARDQAQLDKTAAEIRAATSTKVTVIATDITTDEGRAAALAAAGAVDILVTNAGGPPSGYFDDLDDEAWFAVHQLTLMSAVRLIRAVLPAMRAQQWGRIVNITSVAVKQPIDNLLLSNVYRPGVIGLAKTLSTQVAPDGITVNNVAPGYTRTARVVQLTEARAVREGKTVDQCLAETVASYPMQRMGEPEELAALVAFLASERAGYITGTTIQVDGGYYRGLM